jgi:hypothetical protein
MHILIWLHSLLFYDKSVNERFNALYFENDQTKKRYIFIVNEYRFNIIFFLRFFF